MIRHALVLAVVLLLAGIGQAVAQPLDLSHGGPIAITASSGIEWHQNTQTVIAVGNARAVRGDVTVTADRLIAFYRKKKPVAGATPAAATSPAGQPAAANGGVDTGDNEIYRLEAVGNVHIYTQTDEAVGDHAVYDIDQAVLVLTGRHLKITTPQDVLTARDDLEYWSQKRMAVARGDAVVVTNDGRRISADTLVAYLTPPTAPPSGQAAATPQKASASAAQDPLAASGKVERVEAFSHVVIRTQTQTVTGDRGVYVPDTGIARLAGNTHLTQGQNQVNGQGLEVNLKTGIYRLIALPGQRVQGLVMPNDNSSGGTPAGKPPEKPGAAGEPK